MSLHRFYLPPEQCNGAALTLTGGEAHHALHVLRIRKGDTAIVLDGAGGQYNCEVGESGRDFLQLVVQEKRFVPPLPYQITLLQAVPKGKLFEAIIEKAAELGAWRIVPLLSERVVTRITDARDAAHKAEKWRAVAIEAIKQCGSAWLPQVEPPVTPEQFLARGETPGLSLVGSLQADARHPKAFLRDFPPATQKPPFTIQVWIGPEGDFTLSEISAIQTAGASPITLGRLVLRTETAAIYCLSILNYELQQRDIPG